MIRLVLAVAIGFLAGFSADYFAIHENDRFAFIIGFIIIANVIAEISRWIK